MLGYDQVSMKGKAIKVPPVPGVATAELKALLDAALPQEAQQAAQQQAGIPGGAHALAEVGRLVAVRKHLLPALAKGNDGCGGRLRYSSLLGHVPDPPAPPPPPQQTPFPVPSCVRWCVVDQMLRTASASLE